MKHHPEPARKRAYLVSEGFPGQRKATVHHYVATEPARFESGAAWVFIYQCFETGVRRVWGSAERVALSDSELAQDIEREGN